MKALFYSNLNMFVIKCKSVDQLVLIPKWLKEKWSAAPPLKAEEVSSSVV